MHIGCMRGQRGCVKLMDALIIMQLNGCFVNIWTINVGFTWKYVNLIILLLFILGGQGDKTTRPWMLAFWTTHKHNKFAMKIRQFIKRKIKLKVSEIDFKLKCNASRRFNKLLHVIGIPMWGVGSIPCNVFSWIEKDDDLLKQFGWVRLVKQSLLNSHGMSIKIPNPPKAIKRSTKCVQVP
jgi:hypothetical protein